MRRTKMIFGEALAHQTKNHFGSAYDDGENRDEAKQNGDERPAQGNSHGEASKDDSKNQDEAI